MGVFAPLIGVVVAGRRGNPAWLWGGIATSLVCVAILYLLSTQQLERSIT
jgi:hypothetical protein